MSNKNIKSGFVYNAIFTGINLLFPFISFPYALHVLGPEGIGKSQFAFSFAQYFLIIAAIGIPVYGVREVARCKDNPQQLNRLFSELIIINGLTCVLLSIIYLIAIYSFNYFSDDRLLYVSGIMLVLLSFMGIEWLYTGLSNFRSLAMRTAIVKSISLILIFFLVRSGTDYLNFFLLNIGAITGGNLINVWMIRNEVKFTLKGINLKRHIRPLLLAFGVSVGSSMYTVLDTVLLGFLTQSTAVGLYTCAVKFVKMFMPMVGMMGTVLMPEISKRISSNDLSEGEPLLQKSFQFIVFFSIPVSFGFYLLAPEFIWIFSGENFNHAINTMRILSVLPFFLGMGYFFASQILLPGGNYREVFISVLIGLGLFVALNLLLAPRLLQNGAAIANIISELIVTASYIYFVKKRYIFNINTNLILISVISCLLFFPIVYGVRLLNLSQLPTFGIAVMGCTLIYLLSQWLLFKNQVINYLFAFASQGAKKGLEKMR